MGRFVRGQSIPAFDMSGASHRRRARPSAKRMHRGCPTPGRWPACVDQKWPRRPAYSLGNASKRFIHNDSPPRTTRFSPEVVDLSTCICRVKLSERSVGRAEEDAAGCGVRSCRIRQDDVRGVFGWWMLGMSAEAPVGGVGMSSREEGPIQTTCWLGWERGWMTEGILSPF
jgi:hypothetical protein